jgi:hypothetical protein
MEPAAGRLSVARGSEMEGWDLTAKLLSQVIYIGMKLIN